MLNRRGGCDGRFLQLGFEIQSKMLIVVWVLCLVFTMEGGQVRRMNVFLAEGETWLLFPHRQFNIYTYTTTCSSKQSQASIEHKQFKTISTIQVDNTCVQIDILKPSNQKSQQFFYAKLTQQGLCTVYKVSNQTASLYYQYSLQKQYSSILMINELNVFIWNEREFIKLQYSLFTSEVNVYKRQFPTEDQRKCTLNNNYGIVCWKENDLILLTFINSNINMTLYSYDSDPIVEIIPLSPHDQAFLICSMETCNVSFIYKDKVIVQQSFELIGQIMGGSVHDETNTFVIVKAEAVSLYSFNFYQQIELTLLDNINFPTEFQCSHYLRSLLQNDLIIVECFNFKGQPSKLILKKDLTSNYFLAYDPMDLSNDSNYWVSANRNQLLIVYEDRIIVKQTNFYFLALTYPESVYLQPIKLICIRSDKMGSKQYNRYLISLVPVELGRAYPDEKLEMNRSIVYSQLLSFELDHYFKASDILAYNFTSNCSFIDTIQYTPLSYQQYFSLYNRQKCVQIVAGGGKLFYRLLQINSSLFYVEECLPLTVGFGCQLIDIYDRVDLLRLVFQRQQLITFYIQNQQLVIKHGGIIKIIFKETVSEFELFDSVIRLKSHLGRYFSYIQEILGEKVVWKKQSLESRYFFEGSSVLQLTYDGALLEYIGKHTQIILNRQGLNALAMSQFRQQQAFSFPFLFKQGDFVFIIYQSSITKVYVGLDPILLYSLPINPQKREIVDIKITDIYLTIQYSSSVFQIYDIMQQAVAAKVASLEQKILTDIISMDTHTILIPIQSTTSIIIIERNPITTIGTFSPKYHLFYEICKFRLSLFVQNQSSLDNQSQQNFTNETKVYQQFILNIKYFIEQIDLDDTIEVQEYPQQCHACVLKLKELSYFGPIFSYELNDDYYGQFQLISHLKVEECAAAIEHSLRGLVEVRFEGDYVSSQVMMMDGSRIYIIDSVLAVLHSYAMQNTDFCSSYLKLNDYYLVLCNKYFLLLGKEEEIKGAFLHNLTINYESRLSLELQSQRFSDNFYYLIILDHQIDAHIYQLSLQSRAIQHLEKFSFSKVIDDLKIINDKVIILKHQYLCISNVSLTLKRVFTDSAIQKCFFLADLIPPNYAFSHQYEAFIPYFWDGTVIKALLIAKTVQDLHIDIQIDLNIPYTFKVLNVYAGYPRFTLKQIISVNKTSDSYSYFVLLYQCDVTLGYMIAYYKYNQRYASDGTIGQIRSAQLLQDYFNHPGQLSFATFLNQMFITHINTNFTRKGFQKKKQCLSVAVKDQLTILLNYQQVPPLKFLILQARNLNQLSNHFIRLRFVPSTDQALQIIISLTALVCLLAGIVVATNRCKETDSELQADLFFEQVQAPSGEGKDEVARPFSGTDSFSQQRPQLIRDSTSLLQSKESQYVPPNEYQQSDESIVIRGD